MLDNPFHIDNWVASACFIGHKVIFIQIPKNASTSIRNIFSLQYIKNYKSIPNKENYIKFCVIRNPLTRAVSSYNEIIKLRSDGPANITRNMEWYKQRHNIIKSFDLFLDTIGNNFYDAHAFPQVIPLKHKGLSINDMDHVILFDTLLDGINSLVRKLTNKTINIINANDSDIHKKTQLSDYVSNNEEVQKKIINIYSEDYDLYLKIKNEGWHKD